MTNYKAIQVLRVGEDEYFPGEVFKAIEDGRDWECLVRFNQAVETTETPTKKNKSTAPVTPTPEKEVLTSEEKSSTVKGKKAEVKKAGVWYQIFDENGEKIGSTRDEEEANKIAADYASA